MNLVITKKAIKIYNKVLWDVYGEELRKIHQRIGDAYYYLNDLPSASFNYLVTDAEGKNELEDKNAYYRRAKAFGESFLRAQSIKDFSMAIQLDPYFAEAYMGRGKVYAFKIAPNARYTTEEEFNTEGEMGIYEKAIRDFTKAIELRPQNFDGYKQRGKCYEKIGLSLLRLDEDDKAIKSSYLKAVKDYNKAVELNPSDEESYRRRAYLYSDLGNHQLAIIDYTRLIKMNPENRQAYYCRGFEYEKLNNCMQAIADYSKAIEEYNDYIRENPKGNDVREDLLPGLAAVPDVALRSCYRRRGELYAALGNHRRAINDYSDAIKTKGYVALAFICRGMSYEESGFHDKALEDYNKALESDPKCAEECCNRGYDFYGSRNHKMALRYFNKAIELDPEYSESYVGRAVVSKVMGNPRQVYEDAKIAASLGDEQMQDYVRREEIKNKILTGQKIDD